MKKIKNLSMSAGIVTMAILLGSALLAPTFSVYADKGGEKPLKGNDPPKNTPPLPPKATATTVSSSSNPSKVGQSVSFTANVLPTPNGGTVQFQIDGTNFGSPVTVTSGSATSGSTITLTAGSHTIKAIYSGTTNFVGSTGSLTQTVNPVQTTNNSLPKNNDNDKNKGNGNDNDKGKSGAGNNDDDHKKGIKDSDKDKDNDRKECKNGDKNKNGKYKHNCDSNHDFKK